MRKIFLGILLLIFVSSTICVGNNDKLLQKTGSMEDDHAKQIQFGKIEKIEINFDKAPLKRVKRIHLHSGKIFILDGERCELYVMDKKGKYLYTVGRPGQGPGDLEYPVDFFISTDHKIYILNSMPRRVEVFDIKGKPIRSVVLKPKSVFSYPDSLLVGNNESFITGKALNDLVLSHDNQGKYKNTLLQRSLKIDESTINMGVASQLGFIGSQKDILHFDRCLGTLTILDLSGNRKVSFSGYSNRVENVIPKIKNRLGKIKKNFASIQIFVFWSDFCIDNHQQIFLMADLDPKKFDRTLLTFSTEGQLLYRKKLDFLKGKQIFQIACDNDSFVFLSIDLELILAHRRR